MKRRLFAMIALVLLVLGTLAPLSVGAYDPFQDLCAKTPQAEACQGKDQQRNTQTNAIYGTDGVIPKVTTLVTMVVGIGSVVVIIVAGLQYILSTGDPAKTAKSKNAILFAVIGLAIALLAQQVVIFVLSKL